jgi:hypothetical protein
MRNTIILLCLLILWPTGNAFGQKFELIGGIGIGQCRMQDLKKIQDERLSTIPLPAKITDDFPWTLNYSGELNVHLKNFCVGFAYFFLSSGSRISYSDYSGELTMDITTSAHGFGPSIMYPFYRKDRFLIGGRLQIPLMFSLIKSKDYVRILDESETSSETLYSFSIGLFPSIETSYNLSRWSLKLDIGYLIDSKGRLVEDDNLTIYLDNKDYYTTDWSGFHFDFRLGYILF